jgi:hypothetical protein
MKIVRADARSGVTGGTVLSQSPGRKIDGNYWREREMRSIFEYLLTAALLCCSLRNCVTRGSQNLTYGQDAYDVCANQFNNGSFQSLFSRKALVCGVSEAKSEAFWDYNNTNATNDAINRCQKEFQYCFVFATENGLTDWAQTISNSGGISAAEIDPRNRQQKPQHDDTETAEALGQALLSILSAGHHSPSYYP